MKGRLCGPLGHPHPLLTYISACDLSGPSDPVSSHRSSGDSLHPAPSQSLRTSGKSVRLPEGPAVKMSLGDNLSPGMDRVREGDEGSEEK